MGTTTEWLSVSVVVLLLLVVVVCVCVLVVVCSSADAPVGARTRPGVEEELLLEEASRKGFKLERKEDKGCVCVCVCEVDAEEDPCLSR